MTTRIATAGDLSTRVAPQATATIPIVAVVGFPVESGFVKSLARPGGNITGVAVLADELSVKRLELLKELIPRLSRVAVLWDAVMYYNPAWVERGGLITYGFVADEQRKLSATVIDRILKGAKAADLPVQQPTKFEPVINAKSARALGLTIPPSLLLRADRVIE